MEGIEAAREQLVTLMGDEDEANTMVVDQLNKTAQQEPEEPKGKSDDPDTPQIARVKWLLNAMVGLFISSATHTVDFT